MPEPSAGDPIPTEYAAIRVHVTELQQLFNSIDPSPFRSRDLDPNAEEFIVGWAKDLGRKLPLELVVTVDRSAGPPEEETELREAIHEFFRERAHGQRQQLRELLRVGRVSLAIGLVVLTSAVVVGNLLAKLMKVTSLMKGGEVGQILRETLFIGGWVALWRPMEIFLYDWWPIREEARLSDRLAAMPVRIEYGSAIVPEALEEVLPAVAEGSSSGA
jgi:hypothetical protein